MKLCSRLVVFAATCVVNEAVVNHASRSSVVQADAQTITVGRTLAKLSKSEIMATMTSDSAVKTFIDVARRNPEMAALKQFQLGQVVKPTMQQTIAMLKSAVNRSAPSGYSAVDGATNMLNEMSEETRENLEIEVEKCEREDKESKREMESLRIAVTNFNAAAAGARSRVLNAQGQIETLTDQLDETEKAFETHKHTCEVEISTLNTQLRVVLADIKIMIKVLGMMDCPETTALVQCEHCGDRTFLQHPVQKMLSALKSQVAQQFVKESLAESYNESVEKDSPETLSQEGIQRMLALLDVAHHAGVVHRHGRAEPENEDFDENATLNVSEIPQAPIVDACVPTDKCSLSTSPNCQKLKDRFLVVQAGIVDKRDELEQTLGERENFCKEQTTTFEQQIGGMKTDLREQRTALATATQEQNQAESGSHTQSQAHREASTEYVRASKECCDNQNTLTSELCALGKIRGELNNMEGTQVFITDCEVSDWRVEECSVTCGGGKTKSTRSVITHPVGKGMSCPPLSKEESCNEFPCPVDCELAPWSQWSECSAECGGGVRERSRATIREMQNGGEPCGETEEALACGMDSCNPDCELSEWSQWSSCSKACGGGTQRRTKSVVTPEKGTGTCAEPTSGYRLDFKQCNGFTCKSLLAEINGERGTRKFLKCASEVDVTMILDGSGSTGQLGWWLTRRLTKTLIENLDDGTGNVQVSIILFSGPGDWKTYQACTKDASSVDMESECKIRVVSHFSSDAAALSKKVDSLVWPQGTTLTSVALGMAEAEQRYSRPDAASKVVVITDGKPMSQYNTKAAAARLNQKADVIWVPVGSESLLENVQELAVKPIDDHVIPIQGFTQLWLKYTDIVNKIISTSCPRVA